MACCVELYSQFGSPTIPAGGAGYFIYTGFNTSATGTPANPTVAPYVTAGGITTTIGTGTSGNTSTALYTCIGGGGTCQQEVCFEDDTGSNPSDYGFHFFEYIASTDTDNDPLTGCESTPVTLIIENIEAANPGTPAAVTYCSNENSEINIFNLLGTTSGTAPAWKSGSYSGTGFTDQGNTNITDDTFNPSVAGNGTYTWTHELTSTGAYPSSACPSCTQEAVVTITVTDAPSPGVPANITVCN